MGKSSRKGTKKDWFAQILSGNSSLLGITS
jgi:hypothetical protein